MFCFNITCTGQVFIKKFEANTCNINISVLAAKKNLGSASLDSSIQHHCYMNMQAFKYL